MPPFWRESVNCLAALKFIGRFIDSSRRIILVNGLVNSLVVYAIQLWGIGATRTQIRLVQTLQSQAGKWAMRVGRRTSTVKILHSLNWLSVRQLMIFHSLTLLWQQCRNGSDFMMEEPTWEHSRTQGADRLGSQPYRMEFRRKSWKYRAIAWWNMMPVTLRSQMSLARFKRDLKSWIGKHFNIKWLVC